MKLKDWISGGLIGVACVLLQPKQPRSALATACLCIAIAIS